MIKENSSNSQVTHAGRMRRRKGSNEVPGQANGKNLLVNDQNKYRSMLIRAYSSIWMIGGFIFVVYMGHLYIWAMVVIIQIFMAKELFGLLRKANEDKQLPGFKHLNWHFFFTAMLFVYGRILSQRLVNTVTTDKFLYKIVANLIKYHMVTCYFLYIAGFVWFILSLKKKMYKFLLPASLIVINDIAAYIFGFFFGKTPLIKLSPKKTWEGFIGASVTTIISAFLLANFLGRFQWLTCPRKDLSTGWLQCDPGPLFTPETFTLPGWLPEWFPWTEIHVLPVQWHALALGLFASIIAPFGGFFASGFKRAFKIKDFGDSIPGHGGMTDRMDCQTKWESACGCSHQNFPYKIIILDALNHRHQWQNVRKGLPNTRHGSGKQIIDGGSSEATASTSQPPEVPKKNKPPKRRAIGDVVEFPWTEIHVLPVQWHALALGLFASIIAPFGGF
ncbi:hypothetical protein M8C21_026253, partial [Ambrosia artemisiifolia]